MMSTLFRAAPVCALLLLAGCDRHAATSVTPTGDLPQTLRVYTVPTERAETLRIALQNALGENGRVSLAPPDRLLVVAPVVLQTSVAENLGNLTKAVAPEAPAAAEPRPVRLVAWIVDVNEGTTDARLQPVQSTLDSIRESLAAPGFSLFGQLAITADVGERTSRQSAGDGRAQLEARLTPAEDGVRANLTVMAGPMTVQTETRLKFGETVVLAQAMPNDEGASRIRLVIVRADPAN